MMLLRIVAVLALVFAVLPLIFLVLPRDSFSAPLAPGCCKLTQHELH
jgi:hypothetical protein